MASLRKRFSQWALGDGDTKIKRPVSMDVNRGSIDSGYHSISQKRWSIANSRSTYEGSPKSPSGGLHKALSMTFGYLADTVRQGAASFHQDSTEKDDSASERSKSETTKETPKKQSRRESIFSSVKSRKSQFSPKSREAVVGLPEPPETPISPPRVSNEHPPVLDVTIPHSSMNSESPHRTSNMDSKSPTRNSWPSPTSVAVGLDDPYIDRDDLSIRVRHFVASALSAPSSPRHNALPSDDKGYVAEGESSAEPSDVEAFFSTDVRGVLVGKLEDTIVSAKHDQPGNRHVCVDDRTGSPTKVVIPPRGSSATGPRLLKKPPLNKSSRLPSEMYEADAEVSEASPDVTPSMGSRALWEKARAERDFRYLAAVGKTTRPEDDSPLQHGPPDSPTRSNSDFQTFSTAATDGIGPQIADSPSHTGVLRYAVEAAERRSAMELHDQPDTLSRHHQGYFPTSMLPPTLITDDIMVPEWARDSKAQDDQDFLLDSDIDISENSPSQQPSLLQIEDAYEAGVRVTRLDAFSNERLFSTAPRGSFRDGSFVSGSSPQPSTPQKHSRSVSNLSEVTDDSCAVTTNSPSCDAPPPFPSLHVRSEQARLVSADMKALNTAEKEDIALTGPANSGLAPLSFQAANSEVAYENSAFVTQADPRDCGSRAELAEDEAPQEIFEGKYSTPQKTFNAARLPRFGSSSPTGVSPKGDRSLRRKKSQACGKTPFAEISGNAGKREGTLGDVHPPQFSVRHFDSATTDPSQYSGYEMEPVSFAAQGDQQSAASSPSNCDKKAVSFAKDVEVIERRSEPGHDPPIWVDTDMENAHEMDLRKLEDGLDEEEDIVGRFAQLVESADHRDDSDKENVVDGATKSEKPRWRVPSKVVDS